MEELRSRFVKSVLWLGSTKVLGQLFSWAVTIFLVRLLSPQDFGIVGMVAAYEAIIIIIYDLNLGSALVQKSDLTREDVQTTFWAILVLGVAFYVITLLLAPFVAQFFHNDKVQKVLVVYGLGVFVQSFQQVPYWLLSKRLDFDKRAKAEFISAVSSLVVSLVLAVYGHGLWSLVYGFVVKNCLQALLLSYYFNWGEYFSRYQFFSFSFQALRSLLNFSIPLTGFYSLRYIFTKSDSIIVGRWLGSTSLGYYSVALDLAKIPVDKFVMILNQVCFPVFCELQENTQTLKKYFSKILGIVALVVFPVSIGAALLSRELVFIVLTEKWEPVILPFICLCLVAVLQSIAGVNSMLLNARGRSPANLRFSILGAVTLPLSFLVGVRFGMTGVALSWVVVYPILFLYLCYCTVVELRAGAGEILQPLKAPLYSTVLMSIAVLGCKILVGFNEVSIPSFILYMAVGAIVYTASVLLLSPETVTDFKGIYRDLRSRQVIPAENT